MSFEQDYYEFDRFWNNADYSYKINIEKIKISFDYIRSHREISNLLDAACGNGIFTNMALEQFPDIRIVAFDRSQAALKYVKAEKLVAGIDNIPFPSEAFDCVVAHDVIEHLPVPIFDTAIKELARVAKKYIIIAVPYNEVLEDNISKCPQCKTIFNNDLHFRSFNKHTLAKLFEQTGFSCMDIKTCEPNTFYRGQKLYGDLFYRKWKMHFRSPICPLCGFKNSMDEDPSFQLGSEAPAGRKSLIFHLKRIPKLVWPKYSRDYEMVGLFRRNGEN